MTFPLGWILEHAALPIQHRAIRDVAKLSAEFGASASSLAYCHKSAIDLAMRQSLDGTWNNAILALPSKSAEHFEGVGTIPAARRLIEYGWENDSPPLAQARRILFRLLAEDDDPQYLYELAKGKLDEEQAKAHRQTIREAAGATLAAAGFENDPRLRGFARRALDRIAEFLRSPLAEKPWVRVGNQQVLALEASPPSIYALQMFAHMPLFRSEHFDAFERIYTHLTHPLPRQAPVQMIGKKMVDVPHLVLGDRLPHRNAVEADIPAALGWLEIVARLGYLRRNENWMKMYERFLDDCDRTKVWHPHKGMAFPKSSESWTWPLFPLEQVHGGDERWSDVTFRIGLIARVSGRPIEIR
ncbi:MAG: hypothetical protein K2X99_07845 [Gemmatimonadaceae bacterium]|nr:hypothetical protein [Gemmatimonadaceae bacterium]